MNHPTQSLQIQIHKVDGPMEIFTQSEADLVNRIVNEFQPARIFTREKIIIADGNSLTSFLFPSWCGLIWSLGHRSTGFFRPKSWTLWN